jgi:hypothetical protein
LLKRKRRDGTAIKNLPAFTKIMPYLMPTRTEAAIFYQEDYDVTEALAYIKDFNKKNMRETGTILTLFEVVLCATARAISLRPQINRFIAGKRYYQRNQILLSFVAKKELTDEGKEVNIKVPFVVDETLSTTAKKVGEYIKKGISDDGHENEKIVDAAMKLPAFLVNFLNSAYNWLDFHNFLPYSLTESDPMWSTVFLANVGSFGLNPPFHHLFERGNCPIFMAVGKVRPENRLVAANDGSPALEEHKILRINFSFDDRTSDGIYMGKALDLVRRFIEDPALLAVPEELSPEAIADLGLRPEAK